MSSIVAVRRPALARWGPIPRRQGRLVIATIVPAITWRAHGRVQPCRVASALPPLRPPALPPRARRSDSPEYAVTPSGKLRRVLPNGTAQTITVPVHDELDTGTCRAILRQASRYVSEQDLRPHFYTK